MSMLIYLIYMYLNFFVISEKKPDQLNMSNKKTKNGFMDFCFHQQRLNASLSKASVPQLVEKCAPIWDSLTAGEKTNFKR